MNKKRRDRLQFVKQLLTQASDILDSTKDQEEDALDNIPENLQGTELYSQMENAISCLEDAIDSIDSAKSSVSDAIGA